MQEKSEKNKLKLKSFDIYKINLPTESKIYINNILCNYCKLYETIKEMFDADALAEHSGSV